MIIVIQQTNGVENMSENQKKSAENMENKHNHKRNRKTVEFEIGDAVAQK